MTFISLYRKYRPKKFSDLVGQQQVVQTLKNSIKYDRIAHAYLFAGPRGTGKTSTAKVYARALNCLEDNGIEPCGECENCHRIEEEESLDVIEIDAASNRGIDEIRELREQVKFYPGEGRYKIYIIDEVHMLTRQAFNALLKTLEEPPERVIFILATTEPHNVIPTILSRCQRFDFSLLSRQQIAERLDFISQEEGVKTGEHALSLLADASDGGMRDAISLLDQAISYCGREITISCLEEMLGRVEVKTLSELVNNIAEKETGEVLKITADLQKVGRSAGRIAGDLLDYCRELMLVVNGDFALAAAGLADNRRQLLKEDSRIFNQGEINYLVDKLVELEGRLRRSARPDILLELVLVQITEPESDESPAGLARRLASLEKRLREQEKGVISAPREPSEAEQEQKSAKLSEKAETDTAEKSSPETIKDKSEEEQVESREMVSREIDSEEKFQEKVPEEESEEERPRKEEPESEEFEKADLEEQSQREKESQREIESLDEKKSEEEEYSEMPEQARQPNQAGDSAEAEKTEKSGASDSPSEATTRELTASLWEAILDAIREADIKTHAMIKECRQPVLKAGSLILDFPADKKFHLQSARRERELIQEKAEQVLNSDGELELEFKLEGSRLQEGARQSHKKTGGSSRTRSASSGSGRRRKNRDASSSDIIKQAQQIFGGEIITVSAEVLQEQQEILANLKGGSEDEHEKDDEAGPADAGQDEEDAGRTG